MMLISIISGGPIMRRVCATTIIFNLLFSTAVNAWEGVTDTEALKQLLVDHSELVDPFSVQFRKLKFRHVDSTGADIWCGDINAKNRMGAYTGWSGFYASSANDDEVSIKIIDDDSTYTGIIVTALCEIDK